MKGLFGNAFCNYYTSIFVRGLSLKCNFRR